MRKYLILLLILAFFSIFLGSAKAFSLQTDRIIIKFHSKTPSYVQEDSIKNLGITKKEKLKLSDTFSLTVPKGKARDFINKFSKNKNIEYAEEDHIAKAQEIPNDPYFPNQWGLSIIQAPSAWNITHGSSNVDIAIVDTGIDGVHSDLSSKIVASADCTISINCVDTASVDDNGHGTHVAGIAAAETNNGIGIAGTGYNSSLMSVKVLDSSGSGYYSWVANGIVWAADHGARVINLSLGGPYPSSTLSNAVSYAWNKGAVVVAAAGNNGSTSPLYPAYYPQVLSVAATDRNDNIAWFSNYGYWVKVAAPGVDIFSTYNNGGYAILSGTSMATPFVSGVAGLVFADHPSWTNTQVRNKIESSADRIFGTGFYWQYGRVDACGAVDCNTSISPTPTPTPTPAPSPTPTPTPTPTPSPSPSPTLTPTPTPTSVPSPTSTPTPTPGGPPIPPPPPPPPTPWWCTIWPFLCK